MIRGRVKGGSGGELPLYLRLSERLIREIAAGHLPDGSRLPPERDMAVSLGTSVGTLRKALADLAAKGLLERIHGSGNYVRHRPEVASIYALFRLERPEGGGLPGARILSIEQAVPAPRDSALPGARCHRIRRLRSLEGEPAAIEEILLDAALATVLDQAAISESLYLYYRDVLGVVISRVEDRIGLSKVPDWSITDFRPAAGQPCAHVERTSWSDKGDIVEVSRTWFDNEKARYVSRMGKG